MLPESLVEYVSVYTGNLPAPAKNPFSIRYNRFQLLPFHYGSYRAVHKCCIKKTACKNDDWLHKGTFVETYLTSQYLLKIEAF